MSEHELLAAGRPDAARAIRVAVGDNVVTVLQDVADGREVVYDGGSIVARGDVPRGHKIAVEDIDADGRIFKFGRPIGRSTTSIARGEWVHTHNLGTALDDAQTIESFKAAAPPDRLADASTFLGYRRPDGKVGTRNELWVIPTVACVNRVAERVAEEIRARFGDRIDGAWAFPHPFGCSQLGNDLDQTRAILAGLIRHPNAGAVLVIGLGCENNQLAALISAADQTDGKRLAYFNAQKVADEIEAGITAALPLAEAMATDRREPCPLSDLVIAVKCGGSDGLSGLTANPLVGRIADRVTAAGGTAILSEVPEMFGAEGTLLARSADQAVFDAGVAMVAKFRQYFTDHGEPVYENPSPGNKAGGITTLEEKSLGAVQKGGHAPITSVLDYGTPVTRPGLALLEAPGNDGVSSTAMVASGATVLLFTTGRGTPLGFPAPTIKIASNTDLAERKPGWIDFDAGPAAAGVPLDALADDLFALTLAVASGERATRSETNGAREIAIWKTGVTL